MAANIKHALYRIRMFSKASGLRCSIYRPNNSLRAFSQAVKEYYPDDIMTGSEMPVMFPPQAIKKGFEVHPCPRVFALRPHEKMIWLTKTYLTMELPVELINNDADTNAIEMVKDYVYQIAALQRNTYKPSITFHEEEFSLGLLQQVLQVAFMTAPPKNQDLFLHRKPIIETNWFRNFVFFNAKYHPSFVIRTSDPLQPLNSTFPLPLDEFPVSMPGPFDTYELGAYEKSIIKLKNNTGVSYTKYFKKRHIHSILHVNTNMKTEEFFQSCGLMTSFTNLLAIAQDHGHPLGVPLEMPLNCNCVVTNGTSLLLMVYQLNTTQLNDDKGMWNRAWCSPLLPLYIPKEGYPTKRQFHEIAEVDGLESFNYEAVAMLLKLLSR